MKRNLMLKSKKDITNLFESGKTVSNGVVLCKVLDSTSTKFLFTVSSKKFKSAVDRNRIKRLMKEVVRKIEIKDKIIAFVFVGNSIPTYLEIETSVNKIIKRV